eukprot:scaffold20470_cov153-Skeletonema_marinoi.AAC.11
MAGTRFVLIPTQSGLVLPSYIQRKLADSSSAFSNAFGMPAIHTLCDSALQTADFLTHRARTTSLSKATAGFFGKDGVSASSCFARDVTQHKVLKSPSTSCTKVYDQICRRGHVGIVQTRMTTSFQKRCTSV